MKTLENFSEIIDKTIVPETPIYSNTVTTQIIEPKVVVVTRTKYIYVNTCNCCKNNRCRCCNNRNINDDCFSCAKLRCCYDNIYFKI